MSRSSDAWLPADPQTPFEHAGGLVAGVVALVAFLTWGSLWIISAESNPTLDGGLRGVHPNLAEVLGWVLISAPPWLLSLVVSYRVWVLTGRWVSEIWAGWDR